MNNSADYSFVPSNAILASQCNDLTRRRSGAAEGEHRLLWAVLEDAIESYLANQPCATAKQQHAFAEVNAWFHPAADETRGLFTFESVCDFLAIDTGKLLKGLDSIRPNAARLPARFRASRPSAKPQRPAA